jgi:hypothetical protein
METPTATAEKLMDHATWTANFYMLEAESQIDKHFGEGFAKNHPQLLAAHMNTAALDYLGAMVAWGFGNLNFDSVGCPIERVSDSLDALAKVVQSQRPILKQKEAGET